MILPLILVIPTESVVNFPTFTAPLKVVASDALTVNWRSPLRVLLKVVLVLVNIVSVCRLTASPKV